MTSCADYFEKAIKGESGGEFFDLTISPVCVLDLRKCCVNLYPENIKIISPEYADVMLKKQNKEQFQLLYFCSSAKEAYSPACKAILDGKNAVAITNSKSYMYPIIKQNIERLNWPVR